MLEFKAVSPNDFDRYNQYRNLDITNASEGAFATMFIWNDYYNLEFADNGEFLFIKFNIAGKKPSFFFPITTGVLPSLSLAAINDPSSRKIRMEIVPLIFS